MWHVTVKVTNPIPTVTDLVLGIYVAVSSGQVALECYFIVSVSGQLIDDKVTRGQRPELYNFITVSSESSVDFW